MGDLHAEGVGEVGRVFVGLGESRLYMVEITNGARDGEVHGPQLANELFQGFLDICCFPRG